MTIESERTLETLKRTTQGGTTEVQMLEGCTLYQGAKKLDRITLQANWYKPEAASHVDELRALIDTKVTCRLGRTDFGQWIVARINEHKSFFLADGSNQKTAITLEMIKA